MAKQIIFDYDGVSYTLEFTRKTVKEMEKKGFVASDVEKMPMTLLPMMFEGAFLKHHRFVKKEKIEEIFDALGNKGELIGKLAEMYNDPILTLVDESEQEGKNLAAWKATF